MAIDGQVTSDAGTVRAVDKNNHVEATHQEALLPALWTFWKAYTHRASGYQSAILLTLIYYLVLGPSAIVARLTGKELLRLSVGQVRTYWVERPPMEKTLAALERQF